jgi:hypothetical protein
MASRRHVRTRQQRDRTARRQSGRGALRHRPGRAGGCGRGECERPGRRIDPHRRPPPAAGLYGAEVLELHDRGVVALLETSMALPPLAGQRPHRPSNGRVLRDEHNRVLPHSAFRGQTPDEMYFGTRDTVPADLTSHAPHAGPALRPTDRRPARLAHQSTERSRRVWAATEARAIGYGGIALVERATGISRATIQRGIRELDADTPLPNGRTAQSGRGPHAHHRARQDVVGRSGRLGGADGPGGSGVAAAWTSKSVRTLAVALGAARIIRETDQRYNRTRSRYAFVPASPTCLRDVDTRETERQVRAAHLHGPAWTIPELGGAG